MWADSKIFEFPTLFLHYACPSKSAGISNILESDHNRRNSFEELSLVKINVFVLFLKVVSLSHSIDPVTSRLLDDIKNMKEELKSISQADDFAKYSKQERKILKARQELENSKSGSNTSRLQTKAAIVSFWRMLGVS